VKSPSPVVALARRPDPKDEDFFVRDAPLVIVAVGIQDPGNVGAIVRVAEAAGAAGVVVAGASADPFGWKALRGSMGSALRIPIIVTRDLPVRLPHNGRADGSRFHLLATAPGAHRSVFDADLTGPVAIFIGSEGAGLPRTVLDQADEVVAIPMEASVESLNAATSAAVIAYEARRQRAGRNTKTNQRPAVRG
jgi:TrmH family RNA methyltransferase